MAMSAVATGTGTAALSALAGNTMRPGAPDVAGGINAKARATAVDFEAAYEEVRIDSRL